ncbi:MAG: ion transporter [Sedimentisphaerales bacterium]|nr:ion transporter [Sedimentisphaerales bacterium]
MTLKQIIENNDTTKGIVFDLCIQGMIILSLISFSIDTIPDLSANTKIILRYIEVATVLIFTIEYILRVFVADRKLGFIFSFYGMVDLAAFLPFYLCTGIDLRSIRAVRMLRLIRILKLIRYNKAIQRFHRAFMIAREEIVLFLFASCILLFFAAVGIYYFENQAQPDHFTSVFHSLWWAVATLTTVGYGDIYPITTGGKIFTFFVLMIGLGVVSVPAGLIASALSQARMEEKQSQLT